MRRNKSTLYWTIGIAVVLTGLFALPRFLSHNDGGKSANVPCLVPNVPLVQHIHPHLTIEVDGREETIPANVGLDACEKAIHTHQADGVIHVEAQDNREYTFGDFMDVWGKSIERESFTFEAAVDNQPFDNNRLTDLKLKDNQQIVLKYTTITNNK